jgi:hypothetical protein
LLDPTIIFTLTVADNKFQKLMKKAIKSQRWSNAKLKYACKTHLFVADLNPPVVVCVELSERVRQSLDCD